MKPPKKIARPRNIKQIFQTGILITRSSTRRLLFSKTTIGLIFLCMIPVLVFSLWVGGVFPDETDDLYVDKNMDYFELYEDQVDELQETFGPISLRKDDENISVEIIEVQFYPMTPPTKENLHTINLSGISTGNVSYLNLSIIFYMYGYQLPFNYSLVGPISNGIINFTGLGADGADDWSSWKFELQELPIFILDISQLQFLGINPESLTGDESPLRLGILVQAVDNSSLNESKILWNFDYEEIYIELDDNFVSDFGFVGKDIKKKDIDVSGYDVFATVASQLYFLVVIPLITILYSISIVREDIENHNIVYLISRPISKAEILLFKFNGFFISSWLLITISILISFLIIISYDTGEAVKFGFLNSLILISILYILVYGALFFVFTLITSYPIILSLLFVFVWENIISTVPSVLSRLSIFYWIKALGDRLLPDVSNMNVYLPISVIETSVVLICTTIVLLILAIFLFYNKEFT